MMQIAEALQHAERLLGSGDWSEAERHCRAVLSADPAQCEALNLLGIIALQTGRANEAVDFFAGVVAARPDEAGAHLNHGSVLRALGRFDAALDSCERALTIAPQLPDAHNNRGNVLNDLGRFAEALDSYDRALEFNPTYAEAFNNRAGTLQELGRFEDALESCARALAIRPDFADAHYNRGNALSEGMRFADALDSYDSALRFNPRHAEAHLNRGTMLQALSRLEEAVLSYDSALEANPGLAQAYASRGHARRLQGCLGDASEDYARARQLDPALPGVFGVWLHTRAQLCDWSDYEDRIADAVAGIDEADGGTSPFFAMTLMDSPALQRRAAESWIEENCRPHRRLPAVTRRPRREHLRIGYFSADFRDHATSHLLAGLIESHDRTRFSPIAFSFGIDAHDDMTARLAAAFTDFVEVGALSDLEVAQKSRALDIDIAVDLMGFTQQQRMPMFSFRAAPLQVGYLGYPGTTGAPFMDYLIADSVLIPAHSRPHYSEKIIYLPDSYQINDRLRKIADHRPSRDELGLPAEGFVFCCFNNAYKIVPEVFDGWMRILKAVPASVLWLLQDDETSAANLRREALARGIEGTRLLFAARTSHPKHLARHGAADLFLDTLPVNAHTTASDALWAGLPVLTRPGESFSARVASSLLHAVGLPELIAGSAGAYEALAIEIATQPGRLAHLRQRLEANRLTLPLFDTALVTRHLENAYLQIHDRYVAGSNPEHVWVQH